MTTLARQAKPSTAPLVHAAVTAPRVQRRVEQGAVAPAWRLPVQAQLKVSQRHDPAEREADATARAVMCMQGPIAPAVANAPTLQRKAAGAIGADAQAEAEIRRAQGGGMPLPAPLRRFMEPRLRADFSAVRVHTDGRAAGLASRLAARAFAFGRDIFFGRGEFQPETPAGQELIAHELTHTIQQRAVLQRQASGLAVQQREAPAIQRWGLDSVLDVIAEKANLIPGFRMFTIVLGVNPINMSRVEATPANILRAAIEFIPGAALVTPALDNHGVFDKVANWAAQQIKALGLVGAAIKRALTSFVDSLGLTDLARPGATWDRAKRIFTEPIDRIKNLVKGFVSAIVGFVKEAILKPIAKLAEGTPSYDLLKGVMGEDPITGEKANDSADLMIGGFMKLIGEGEVYDNARKSGAVPKAWAWFKGALADLKAFVRQIPPTFVAAFKSLELADIILVPRAFAKLAGVFGGFLVRFISWAGQALWNLLEIIFSVVKPGALDYIKKTGAALKGILKDPLPFVGNLAKAARAGFQNFASRFGSHLQKGLIEWLTGALVGVYIPKALSLPEVIKFALSVLGLTWANLRAKLVKAFGETAVAALEKGFALVKTLVTEGPAAAWEQMKAELLAQKDVVIDGIKNMVIEAVVTKAIPKLIAMFIPGAGFISAIVSIYDMVMVFVQKLAKIKEVVVTFVDSIVAIAGGAIDAAAAKVESVLAGLLSLAINFLAGFAGLGKIAAKINGIIEKIRKPVDKAMDSLVGWIKKAGKFIFDQLKKGAKKLLNWWKKKSPFRGGGESHAVVFDGEKDAARLMVRSKPQAPADFVLEFVPSGASTSETKKIADLTKDIDSTKKKLAAEDKKDPPNEAAIKALDSTLTQQMNALGATLAALLDLSEDEGTPKRPVPVVYPKRRAAAYPNIYVGPLSGRFIKQEWLRLAANAGGGVKSKNKLEAEAKAGGEPQGSEPGFMSWDGRIEVYKAAAGPKQKLPNGSEVGLDPAFASLAPGKVLVYDVKGSTGGGSKINNLFRPFGFRPGKEGMDGDHVMERQLGGPDIVPNLWPLPAGENRSSGSTVKSINVTFKAKKVTVHKAREMRKKKNELHLLIKSTVGG